MLEGSIGIAKRLGMRSVAEGVETEEDWRCCARSDATVAQGYFIGRPMAVERAARVAGRLAARRALRSVRVMTTSAGAAPASWSRTDNVEDARQIARQLGDVFADVSSSTIRTSGGRRLRGVQAGSPGPRLRHAGEVAAVLPGPLPAQRRRRSVCRIAPSSSAARTKCRRPSSSARRATSTTTSSSGRKASTAGASR